MNSEHSPAFTTAAATLGAAEVGTTPDFEVRLTGAGGVLLVEVTDTRTDRAPLLSLREPDGHAESGRGLILVAALATRWGVTPRPDDPGKTVGLTLVLSRSDSSGGIRTASRDGVSHLDQGSDVSYG